MITIYIAYFDEPLRRGVPLPVKKQIDITLDGFKTLFDMLQGMGEKVICCVSTQMEAEFLPLIERLKSEGHEVIITDDKPSINYWRSLHILSPGIVAWYSKKTPIVFNAWEFSQKIEYNKELRLPFIIKRNAGTKLAQRLAMTIDKLKNKENGI